MHNRVTLKQIRRTHQGRLDRAIAVGPKCQVDNSARSISAITPVNEADTKLYLSIEKSKIEVYNFAKKTVIHFSIAHAHKKTLPSKSGFDQGFLDS